MIKYSLLLYVFVLRGPQTSEWANSNNICDLYPTEKDFLVIFLTKQCSQGDNSTFVKFGIKLIFIICSILDFPGCPNLKCHKSHSDKVHKEYSKISILLFSMSIIGIQNKSY